MSAEPSVPSYVAAPEPELAARRAATKLRNVLRLNAAFSVVTGLAAAVAAGPIASWLDVDQTWLVRSIGIGLVGFALVVLAVAATRTSVLRRWSLLVSLADLGWVAGTAGVVAAGLVSTAGAVGLAVVALAVLDFGLLQLRARARLQRAVEAFGGALEESPPVEVIEFTRASPNAVDDLWPVITDHALYARLALNLKAAEGLTPNGPGFRRSCTDSIGRTWSETCTWWEPGRRFDVDVELDDYPYPLQLVQGSWRVEPGTRTPSTVGMVFAVRPEASIAGRLFLPVMHLLFGPILRRIARGWDRAASERSGTGRVEVGGSDAMGVGR